MIRTTTMALLSITMLTSCASLGPKRAEIDSSPAATPLGHDTTAKFALVTVDNTMAEKVSDTIPKPAGFFSDVTPGPSKIGAGDTLQINILSPATSGPTNTVSNNAGAPISSVVLPPQQVSALGTVSVPPLGPINLTGLTIPAAEDRLGKDLGAVLVQPSVIVQMTERHSARATVIGDLGATGPIPLTQGDTRLLDLVSANGGPKAPLQDLDLSLSRKGQTHTIPLVTLIRYPRYNVHVLPGDVITVEPPVRDVVVLGAGSSNQNLSLVGRNASLASVLGQIGGLRIRQADRRGVFVYRDEPYSALASLGFDTHTFRSTTIPTIFQFDLGNPTGLFTASKFKIRNGDIVYIAESFNEQLSSAVQALSPFVPQPSAYIAKTPIH